METTRTKNVPEISIKYNRFLDPIFIFYCKNNPELRKGGWNDWIPPSNEEVLKRVENYKKEWQKTENKILRGMCEITGLDFKRNIIEVHIVSGVSRAFSEPLVLKSGFPPEEFVDVLSHELIHVLFQDNIKCVPVEIVSEMFPEESQLTKNHVIVHAVLKYIYLEVLKDESRLNRNMERSSKADMLDYVRAWEIVRERGYRELITEFRKRYRSFLFPRNTIFR